MIGLEINGEFLELNDTNFRLEKINPSFITELFQNDYSFPFTIIDTPVNLGILGFTNVIELFNRVVEYDGYLWLFGAPYLKVKIIVSAGTNNSITINVAGGIKAMRIADKSLKELNYGDDYTLGATTDLIVSKAKTISLVTDYTTYGFTFVPHKNEDFYGSNNTDFCGIVNRQDSTTGAFLKNDVIIGNKYCLVPWLYLFFILTKIFEEEGLVPAGEFWDDEEMQKLLLYNNYALDASTNDDNCYVLGGSTISYNTNTRLQLYKGPVGSFDAANAWSNTAFEYTIQAAGDIVIDILINAYSDPSGGSFFGTYVPHFNLYIDGVYTGALNFPTQSVGYFSRSLSIEYTATVGDIGKKIYLNNVIAPVFLPLTGVIFQVIGTSYMLVTNNSAPLNIYSKTLSYKNHVPDITVSEFLAQFKNLGISFEFDYGKGIVNINYDKDYVSSADYLNWTGKTTAEYQINFEEKNKGFVVNYDFGSSDKLVEGNFKKYLASNFKGEFPTYNNIPFASTEGHIVLVSNSNQLYITVQNPLAPGVMWKFFGDNYYDIVLGRGEVESKSKFAPMFMDFAENENGTTAENRCLIPVSKQQGSSQMFGMGVTDFDLRFVYLRGVNQSNSLVTPEGGVYIYASSTRFGINGNTVGNFEFPLQSEYGIIKKLILDFLIALNNAEIIERDITLNELEVLILNVKKRAQIDGSRFLIKSVSISVDKFLKKSRAKMLKI